MLGKVSVIIVNFNGKYWIEKCLTSVVNQSYKNIEIIVVDNASTDNSIELIQRNKKKLIKLYKNDSNDGYAGGCNIGISLSTGKYILLLNTDSILERKFIENILKAFGKIPNLAIAQSKINYMDNHNIIDTCGSFWTNTSLLYHFGNSKRSSLAIYNKPFAVFSIKGVAAIVKKSIVDEIGLFDDKFWCYYEETDFCHRAWLSGYQCWYWPEAVVYHAGGGTSLTFANDFIQFHNFKNKLLSFLKNFETKHLLYIIPEFLCINLLLSVYWLLQGKYKHTISLYKAIGWNIKNFSKTYEKRQKVQELRKIRDVEYFRKVKKTPRLSYYFSLVTMDFTKYQDKKI